MGLVDLTSRACSSAGEHYVDIVGVTGSIPVTPTIFRPLSKEEPGRSGRDLVMKVKNSIKSQRARHRDNRIVRRRGRLYVINKTNRRFKARQG